MRAALLVVIALAVLALGGTCWPLIDATARSPAEGTVLSITLTAPDTDANVPAGTSVRIAWVAGNLTGQSARVTLIAESRTSLARTTLLADSPVSGTGGSGEFSWNTEGYSGTYALYARIQAGDRSIEKMAPGKVTVFPPLSFTFTGPTTDQELVLDQDPPQSITISWVAGGLKGTAGIGLDTDQDHGAARNDPNTSRNEIFIHSTTLTLPAAEGSFKFEGKDKNGQAVEPGTYYLFAIAEDGVNQDFTAEGLARITVVRPEPNEAVPALRVTKPASDVTLLDPNTVTIEYEVHQTERVLVDLKADTDDNHTNGNEITLNARRPVDPNSAPVTFDWDGKDAAGTRVADGIYRVFASFTTGTGAVTRADPNGLVFVRSAEKQPLIALLLPAITTTVDPGQTVFIKWRDDDPDGGAVLRITVDDDPNSAEASETGADELIVLDSAEAEPDGVDDTFTWQVPESLGPGTYYIFAYIYATDPNDPPDCQSKAPGRVIIKDPSQ
jgi:flagellar hook assembly protein FlgD